MQRKRCVNVTKNATQGILSIAHHKPEDKRKRKEIYAGTKGVTALNPLALWYAKKLENHAFRFVNSPR
jgi:hypothetical protein